MIDLSTTIGHSSNYIVFGHLRISCEVTTKIVQISFQTNTKIMYYSKFNCVPCKKIGVRQQTYATTADERRGHYHVKYGNDSRTSISEIVP